MKNTIKLFGVLLVVFGVFAVLGTVSASQVDILQPAELVTYDEDVDVNGTLSANSVYIGEEGVGGVTFFNGSIVNVGATTPVTIADDMRVDGEIWRTEKGGPNPVKISDHMIPTLDNRNELGSFDNRWSRIHTNELWASRARVQGGLDFGSRGSLSGNLNVIGSGSSAIIHLSSDGDLRLSSSNDLVDVRSEYTTFDGLINLKPKDGTSHTCNSSSYGNIIFSTTDLGNGANRFYGCIGTGGDHWSPF